MSRFFKKSKYIKDLNINEIEGFLRKENLVGKVTPERIQDFYNALSTVFAGDGVVQEESIDYSKFNANTDCDSMNKVNHLRTEEQQFLDGIDKSILSSDRMIAAAAALSYKFEKDRYDGQSRPNEVNSFLKNFFTYSEDNDKEGNPVSFGEALEMDLSFIEYLALLSTKKAFSTDHGKLEKDASGKVIKYNLMESMTDVINMDLIQCVMPDFERKLAKKELYTRTRYAKIDKGQNLVILVDDSGSMSDAGKKAMLRAALTLKLKQHTSTHHVYIGTFENDVDGFIEVKEGMKFEDLDIMKLDRGGTDVNGCVKDTIRMIKARTLKGWKNRPDCKLDDNHFEIMVINDGTDSVDPNYHPDIKLHALCLRQSNPDLKNICHRSGGTYHHLKAKGER